MIAPLRRILVQRSLKEFEAWMDLAKELFLAELKSFALLIAHKNAYIYAHYYQIRPQRIKENAIKNPKFLRKPTEKGA